MVDVLCALLPLSDIVTVTEFHMEFHKIWEEQGNSHDQAALIHEGSPGHLRQGGRRFEKDLRSAVPNYRIFPPSRAPGC